MEAGIVAEDVEQGDRGCGGTTDRSAAAAAREGDGAREQARDKRLPSNAGVSSMELLLAHLSRPASPAADLAVLDGLKSRGARLQRAHKMNALDTCRRASKSFVYRQCTCCLDS